MEVTIPISRLTTALKALGGVCNLKSVKPEHKYIGLRGSSEGVTLVACNADMLGVCDWEGDPDVKMEGLEGDEQSAMIDSTLFSELVSTFDAKDEMKVTVPKDSKTINFQCGRHSSDQQYNFNARFEDLHVTGDYGKGKLSGKSWTKVSIDQPGLGLFDVLQQVYFVMPKVDVHTDSKCTSGVRLTIEDADEGGSWVRVHATDSYRFVHFRVRIEDQLPECDLWLDHSIVSQVVRMKFTNLYFNGQSFAFTGGDSGMTLYSRALGTLDKFPDLESVFIGFRSEKKVESFQVDRIEMRQTIRRQLLFADQREALLFSEIQVDPKNQELLWGAANQITRGSDATSFSPAASGKKVTPRSALVNLQGLYSYVEHAPYKSINVLVAPKDKKTVLIGFQPDLKFEPETEEKEPAKSSSKKKEDEGVDLSGMVDDDDDGLLGDQEGEEAVSDPDALKIETDVLRRVDNEFIFVTGASLPKEKK